MKLGIKTLTAATAAAVMLFLAVSPAAAVTSNDFDITDGELQTSVGNFELDGSGTPPPCGGPTSTLLADVSNGPPWTTQVTDITIETSITLGTAPPVDYSVTITLDTTGGLPPNAGTIANPSLAVSQNLRATVSIKANCGAGAEVCRIRVIYSAGTGTALAGVVSTSPDGVGNLPTGSLMILNGSSQRPTAVLGGPGCNPPFASLTAVGSTVTIPAGDPLVLEVLP